MSMHDDNGFSMAWKEFCSGPFQCISQHSSCLMVICSNIVWWHLPWPIKKVDLVDGGSCFHLDNFLSFLETTSLREAAFEGKEMMKRYMQISTKTLFLPAFVEWKWSFFVVAISNVACMVRHFHVECQHTHSLLSYRDKRMGLWNLILHCRIFHTHMDRQEISKRKGKPQFVQNWYL